MGTLIDESYDSSSEEENVDNEHGDEVLRRVFKDYKEIIKAHPDDQSTVAGYTQENIRHGTLTCLICISSIKRANRIWTCGNCFDSFHLECIQQWVKDGVIRKGVLSDRYFPGREIPWCCPKCRFDYERSQYPSQYYCYCGQTENPPHDPWLVAHSCGKKCERYLRPRCGHQCILLCHPGPCPPCPVMVKASCFCGKTGKTIKRCGTSLWSCGRLCGKLLACGRHVCKDVCHDGACPPCSETVKLACVCGKSVETKPCGISVWHCQNECRKTLSCGLHHCRKVCHKDECGGCPKSGFRTCPCGKSQKVNLPCTEEVPTCNDTCGKSLGCSNGHKCSRRCHYGECGQCSLSVVKKCKCGKKEKQFPCSKEFTCNIKCQKRRDCGVHQCKKMCCDGNCPSCDQICGRSLQCKRHKCQSLCHGGKCFPCVLQSTLSCKCGSTKISVMCGKEKSTKPPRCNKLCSVPSSCHHPRRQPHNCHFGPCPRCTQVCNQELPCGHFCVEKCHDEVLVEAEVKVSGPWELAHKSNFRVKKLPCSPCNYGITVECFGKHENSKLPCFRAKSYCCGRPCGQLLNCGIHKCEMPCHIIESADGQQGQTTCMECEKPCSISRPTGCTHPCPLPCHPGPCKPCKNLLRIRCHCGVMQLKFLCCDYTTASKEKKFEMACCGNLCQKPLPCGHPCGKLCHSGSCSSSCKKKLVMKCPCKRKKTEFLCPEVQNGAALECDAICNEKAMQRKASMEEMMKKEKMQQSIAEQKELERFERMMNKSSKSRRKRSARKESGDDSKDSSFVKKYAKVFSLMFFIAIALAFLWNLLLVDAA